MDSVSTESEEMLLFTRTSFQKQFMHTKSIALILAHANS